MHTLICGVTLSGKTTLARALCRRLDGLGQNTVVYDPVGTATAGGGWGERSIVFDDADEFWAYMADDRVVGAHVFVDEAGDQFGVSQKQNHWLATRGRHFHLYLYMIAQRPKMIAPTVRTQAGRCYMFRLACEDAKEVGMDFGHSGLDKKELDTGDFLILDSGQAQIVPALNIFTLLEKKP